MQECITFLARTYQTGLDHLDVGGLDQAAKYFNSTESLLKLMEATRQYTKFPERLRLKRAQLFFRLASCISQAEVDITRLQTISKSGVNTRQHVIEAALEHSADACDYLHMVDSTPADLAILAWLHQGIMLIAHRPKNPESQAALMLSRVKACNESLLRKGVSVLGDIEAVKQEILAGTYRIKIPAAIVSGVYKTVTVALASMPSTAPPGLDHVAIDTSITYTP
jgi:hypothetical protein